MPEKHCAGREKKVNCLKFSKHNLVRGNNSYADPKNALIKVKTYFRDYFLNTNTGDAFSKERKVPPLFFASRRLRRRNYTNKYSIYDYFASNEHADLSVMDAKELIALLNRMGIRPHGNILDLSGGNGVVLVELQKEYNISKCFLTEINEKAIDFANSLQIAAIRFDLENDDASKIPDHFAKSFPVKKIKYDYILLRACIMFCPDLGKLLRELSKILNPGGKIIIQHSVEFTLGMALRTQLDDSSYIVLRTPQSVTDTVTDAGFKITYLESEVDSSMYVYENDRSYARRLLHVYYEQKMINALKNYRFFRWATRTRQRSHYLLELR